MSKMYKILVDMKDRFSKENWLVLVEQAYDREKITDEEFEELTAMVE